MKIGIDFQEVDISEEEYEYYKEILKQLGDNPNPRDHFKDLFWTDDRGFITTIRPKTNVPWVVLFFIQQLMISQRLRLIDDFVLKQEKK